MIAYNVYAKGFHICNWKPINQERISNECSFICASPHISWGNVLSAPHTPLFPGNGNTYEIRPISDFVLFLLGVDI